MRQYYTLLPAIWFRIFLTLSWVALGCLPLKGQSVAANRESGGYWATKGQHLMRASQYAEAYTAFQLARSLGAPDMATQMALAKKRNINSIQLRALVAEARAQAATDPTQSLRLLEYARSQFPDSSSLLRAIGDIVNQPDNWYYTLRADSLKASPRFTYLLADTDKCRLYSRRGDSLTLIHTFAERPGLRVFSADDRYLFVVTGQMDTGVLYALGSGSPKVVRTYGDLVTNMRFSPGFSSVWDYVVVEYNYERLSLYHRAATIFSANFLYYSNSAFSPTGRYLTTLEGIWKIVGASARPLPLQLPGAGEFVFNHVRFSDQDRNLLITQRYAYTGTWEDGSVKIKAALYRMPEQGGAELGDTVRIGRLFRSFMQTPRHLWTPLSSDGRYYCLRNRADSSLFFYDRGQWQPVMFIGVRPDSIRKGDFINIRFSPNGRHILVAWSREYKQQGTQLWRLDGQQARLIHEFTRKVSIHNDVFSADGAYLLARHTDGQTTRLWHLADDTVRLAHEFRKPLQVPSVFDADGHPVYTPYFSQDSRYLITYAATPQAADSLWQLDRETLQPLHGFGNRLEAGSTAFSPDSRYVLVSGNGVQPATLWNLPMQQTLMAPNLLSTNEALFSPKGNYLLTDSAAWRVTDRGLLKFRFPVSFPSLVNCRFSPDERHLAHSLINPDSTVVRTALYEFSPTEMKVIRATQSNQPAVELMEGTMAVKTYQGGVFSPDGSSWLSALAPIDSVFRFQLDTLWQLPTHLLPGGLTRLGQTTHRIDKLIVNPNAWYSVNQRWHVSPAALFSRDGRFLMTKEQDSLRFYSMKPTMSTGKWVAGQAGWPIDVSAGADYWLTRADLPNEFVTEVPANERYKLEYSLADTPDTVQLWRRNGTGLLSLGTFRHLYYGLNVDWQEHRRQSWFSPKGNYMLLPTTDPALTTLFQLVGNNPRPLAWLNLRLSAAAWVCPNSASGQGIGLLYSGINQQTYLLRWGDASPGGKRSHSLGFGTLHLPPRVQGKLAYWVRKIDESQQNLEILDLVSAFTLVKIPFGSVLDVAVRPNGDAWVVSTTGARLVRSPETTLRWLKQAPVAALQPALRQLYSFQ